MSNAKAAGVLKGFLLFAAGVLLGANAVYFLMTRPDRLLRSPPVSSVTAPGATEPSRTAPTDIPAASSDVPASHTVPAGPTPPSATSSPPDPSPAAPAAPAAGGATAVPTPSGLIVPVWGVQPAQLGDTFSQARSEGRVHEALDIMAPRGTPVVAVADGTVEKLFFSKYGGHTIYQFEPSGRYAYYYAHLDRYAAGLTEDKAIRQGEVIGYVGSSGNANPAAPHLHFAVFLLGPERRWWQGTAINPYPLFKSQ